VYCRFPAVELQKLLVPPLPLKHRHLFGIGAICQPHATARFIDQDKDLIRRFTHIAVLHWQAWADLVHLVQPEPGYCSSLPPPSASPSPLRVRSSVQAASSFQRSSLLVHRKMACPFLRRLRARSQISWTKIRQTQW
jgi:hypothetical protein